MKNDWLPGFLISLAFVAGQAGYWAHFTGMDTVVVRWLQQPSAASLLVK